MLKIWKGPEMEGTKVGTMTLFICSDKQVSANLISELILRNPDVRRIYFGAGRKPFCGVDDYSTLYNFLFRRSIEIVIEVSFDSLSEFIKLYDSLITTFIVTQYDAYSTFNNLQYKTDDTKKVIIYGASSQTSLETLKDSNMFVCDQLLFKEE